MARPKKNSEALAPPQAAIAHPGPGERAHLWQRPARPDEVVPEVVQTDYPHALPRWVHKNGEAKRVDTIDACDAALEDGWEIHPTTAG